MNIKCSVFIAASLDGFIARLNGDLDWLSNPAAANNDEDYGYKAFFENVDSLVIGRKTYERVLTFSKWPYTGKRVIVLSRTSPAIPVHLVGIVEVVSSSPSDLVRRLAAAGMRHIYVDGGITIRGFLNAGLINELTITRIPILLGVGIPLFTNLDRKMRLEHLETISFPGGFVQSRYRIDNGA